MGPRSLQKSNFGTRSEASDPDQIRLVRQSCRSSVDGAR